MDIAISGSRGLVATALIPRLKDDGHKIIRLVREQARESEVLWNPAAGEFRYAELEGVDAVVHLAGESIAGGRWSQQKKKRIRDSRVEGTRMLCEGLLKLELPPKALLCASAVGYYGDRGDEVLDEDSSPGSGFLASVARQWEEATQPVVNAGMRVVHLRFGMILSPQGGALEKMLTPFKLGMGGVIGSGRQYWSWVSIDDVVNAMRFALFHESLSGPANVVAPESVTNRVFTKALGKILSRPTILPMPAFAAQLALGEMADALLLASTRVVPKRLAHAGYEFDHQTLTDALRHVLRPG